MECLGEEVGEEGCVAVGDDVVCGFDGVEELFCALGHGRVGGSDEGFESFVLHCFTFAFLKSGCGITPFVGEGV